MSRFVFLTLAYPLYAMVSFMLHKNIAINSCCRNLSGIYNLDFCTPSRGPKVSSFASERDLYAISRLREESRHERCSAPTRNFARNRVFSLNSAKRLRITQFKKSCRDKVRSPMRLRALHIWVPAPYFYSLFPRVTTKVSFPRGCNGCYHNETRHDKQSRPNAPSRSYRDAVNDLLPKTDLVFITRLTMTFNIRYQTGTEKTLILFFASLFPERYGRRTKCHEQHSKLHLVASSGAQVV